VSLQSKTNKLLSILRKPAHLKPVMVNKLGRALSKAFKGSSFYVQSQMDIHPDSTWRKADFISTTNGFMPRNGDVQRALTDIEPWDSTRRDMLTLLLRTITENAIPGHLAELGVYKGHTARLIHLYAPERQLCLFDTFSGFGDLSVSVEGHKTGYAINAGQFSDTSIDKVKALIKPNKNVSFFKGYFPESLPEGFDSMRFAFVHLDADLYDPTINGLKIFYPKMSRGGFIVIHDYNAWIGARTAVDEFFADKPEKPIPMPDKSGSAIILKQ
jgi:O-methyltransferase